MSSMSPMTPRDDESLEEYTARMAAIIEESELEAVRNIDRQNFVWFVYQTARREGRPFKDYLPEDDPLRRHTPERFKLVVKAFAEANATGRPLRECLDEQLKPGDPPWF